MSSGKPEAQPTPPSDRASTKRKTPPDTPTKNTMPPAKEKAPQESAAGWNEAPPDAANKLTAKIDEFRIQLQELSASVVSLTRLGEMNTAEIKEFRDKVQRLEEENEELKENVLGLERHKRRWNLKLHGLTENDGERTRDVVVEILSAVAPQWAPSMEAVVDAARRLGRRDEGRIRWVVVWFTTRRHRDAFWKICKNSRVCKELRIRFKRDFCKADRLARAVARLKMVAARAEEQRAYYRGHVGYIDGVGVEMAKKPHEDSRNMAAALQPDTHPITASETENMRRQYSGRRVFSQSNSSYLSSTSSSTSNEGARQGGKDLEDQAMEIEHSSGGDFKDTRSSPLPNPFSSCQCSYNVQEVWEGKDLEYRNQNMKTEHGGRQGSSEKSSGFLSHSSMALVPLNRPENQKMEAEPGSGGDFSHTMSSSSHYCTVPYQGTGNAKENWEGKDMEHQKMMTQQSTQYGYQGLGGKGPGRLETKTEFGGGDHSGHASSSSFPPSSSSTQSTQYGYQGLGGKGPGRLETKTEFGGGDHSGHASSSSFPPSSSSTQSTQYGFQGLGGKGPGRLETKTEFGGGDHSGHASASSFPPSSSSTQSTQYGNQGLGGKGPGRLETKTEFGGGDHSGHASASSFPPSSSSTQSTQYGNQGLGGKGPGRLEMKTQSGERDGLSPASSYETPPSSPPLQQFESGGWENRKRMDEEWKEEGASSCCPETKLKRIQHCRGDLGQLKPSKKHTVLVDSDAFNIDRRIVPFGGMHVWQPNFVKLPCAQNTGQGGFNQDSRWKQIKKQLSLLASRQTAGVREVAETIISFNPKYSGQWSFESLSKFTQSLPKEDNYINRLIPKIAALAMKLPQEVQMAIPLLRAGHIAAITLSQAQIACLLANAFFCTFPHRNTSTPNAEYHNYPSINFSSLFGNRLERKNEKLRAIMHYFKVVTDRTTNLNGLVTFERRLLRGADQPEWRSCTEKINKLYVSSDGCIEREGSGLLQVDFANSWIGGGVLGSGLVQEEILFLINPELIVSRLFTERLQDDECLVVMGSQQFSSYSGYSDTFVWLGPHEEKLQRDEWARLQRQIVAIDALHYRNWKEQYRMDKIKRELNKAYCGFKGRQHHDNPDIATGKWGCGAFNGDPQLKAVIQLMAAGKAGRGLAFFTFNNKQLERDLQRMHHLLVSKDITVGKLYGLLQDYCTKVQRAQLGLFDFLWRTIASESQKKHQNSCL